MANQHRKPSLILSVNAGSSSLKIALFSHSKESENTQKDREPITLLLTSSISNISSPPAKFSFERASSGEKDAKEEDLTSVKDHASAFAHFLDYLKNEASIDRNEIAHVCHRVVHGGDYTDPVVISDESYHHIEKLSDLAPLHNGSALSVIKACIKALPNANAIAYFDTAFHRSIPLHIASYAIDQDIAKKRGLKKYGFHGLSYAFVLRSVAKYLEKPPTSLNLIILHLGSGASVCAVKNGLSLDTSMGLTPLNGLPGATRSGAIDPSLIFHYTSKAGKMSHDPKLSRHLLITEAEDILNTKSGWKSITGTTDFSKITSKANLSSPFSHDNPHRLAFDIFTDRILNYIGSYYVKLNGQVDALVFAGGIGEHGRELREVVVKGVECLGFGVIDAGQNADDKVRGGGVVVDIGSEGKDKRILVCKTDEQREMARECALEEKFWE
jgi:acetate kinase